MLTTVLKKIPPNLQKVTFLFCFCFCFLNWIPIIGSAVFEILKSVRFYVKLLEFQYLNDGTSDHRNSTLKTR